MFPEEKRPIPIDRAGHYAGTYATAEGAQFIILARENGLALECTGQPALPIYATSPLEFFARGVGVTLKFEENAAGDVSSLTLTQDGTSFKAEKKEEQK